MTDEELIARWDDYVESMGSVMGEVEHMAQQMRDRIEALVKERDEALEWLSASQGYIADAVFALDKQEKAEARAERLEAALRKLHHAVCGETGFAACVRLDSGKAYPWPALDDADETARAALKGGDHE